MPRTYGLPTIHKEGCPLRPPHIICPNNLASPLKPTIGKTESHIQNSAALVETLDTLVLAPTERVVSLDIVSLHTRVPLGGTVDLLVPLFSTAIVKIFEFVAKSTYCTYSVKFYEQVKGEATESPLAPVIANFFMNSL